MYVVVAALGLACNIFATAFSTGEPFEGPVLIIIWVGLALILIAGRVSTLASP